MASRYGFEVAGIEPIDIEHYGEHARREFWRAVVTLTLIEKDAELARGLDIYGDDLVPISPYTRAHRKSWTGKADPNAPPLTPAYRRSRTRVLLDGRALRNKAEFFWRSDPVTGRPWGRVLGYHREGAGYLPERDVIGLSPKSLARIKAAALKAWERIRKGEAAPKKTDVVGRLNLPKPPKPAPVPKPTRPRREPRPPVVIYLKPGQKPSRTSRAVQVYEVPDKPPPKAKAKAPPKPPKPAPKAPPKPVYEGATPEIRAAAEAQHLANLAAAAARPVVTESVRTPTIRSVEKDVEYSRKQLEKWQAAIVKGQSEEWKRLQAEFQKYEAKANDWNTTKATRARWEKKLEAISRPYHDLKAEITYAPGMVKMYEEQHAKNQAALVDAKAHPDATRDYPYADLVKKYPNLIPRGPIEDRIKAYTVGDAKVKALADLDPKNTAQHKALVAEADAFVGEMRPMLQAQAKLVEKYAQENLTIPADVQAKVDDLQKQVDALIARRGTVHDRHQALIKAQRLAAHEVLEVKPGAGAMFTHSDVPAGYIVPSDPNGLPLNPIAGPTVDKVQAAQTWLGKVVAKSDVDKITTRIGEAPGARAHWSDHSNHMQIMADEDPAVVAHEYGHGIDYNLSTGGDQVVKRSQEFLKYRVGDEVAIDMHAKFGRGDPGEMGRKDKFDSVFSDYSAHYTGKDYGEGATEVVSMGVQLLYNDPIRFAQKDPEFCKFILGILDGSLR